MLAYVGWIQNLKDLTDLQTTHSLSPSCSFSSLLALSLLFLSLSRSLSLTHTRSHSLSWLLSLLGVKWSYARINKHRPPPSSVLSISLFLLIRSLNISRSRVIPRTRCGMKTTSNTELQ